MWIEVKYVFLFLLRFVIKCVKMFKNSNLKVYYKVVVFVVVHATVTSFVVVIVFAIAVVVAVVVIVVHVVMMLTFKNIHLQKTFLNRQLRLLNC